MERSDIRDLPYHSPNSVRRNRTMLKNIPDFACALSGLRWL